MAHGGIHTRVAYPLLLTLQHVNPLLNICTPFSKRSPTLFISFTHSHLISILSNQIYICTHIIILIFKTYLHYQTLNIHFSNVFFIFSFVHYDRIENGITGFLFFSFRVQIKQVQLIQVITNLSYK